MVCAKAQPYLEANTPTLKANINKLKRIQRLATRLVRGPHHVPFEERLLQLNLFSLERRCLRADLILAFQILNSDADRSPSAFFLHPPRAVLRAHTYKLLQKRSRLRACYAILKQAPFVLSTSLSVLKKTVVLPVVRNLSWSTCVNSVSFHRRFSLYCNPKVFMSPWPPIPCLFMWSLLALVATPTINK